MGKPKAIFCSICKKADGAKLITGAQHYTNRPDLAHIKLYRCSCGASVGCHPGTDRPLGTTADQRTKRARNRAHAAFDPIWKNGYKKRSMAYAWLASKLGIEKALCHIALFDAETCDRVVQISEGFMHAFQARG